MLEHYKRRLSAQGSYIGEVIKKQSDMIMDETFKRDVACKKCFIDGELVYAKFFKHRPYTLNKFYIDYRVQFMTGVHYPVGTLIKIPDDIGNYNTWLIAGRDDDSQFVKYLVLKCNLVNDKEIKWIYKNTLFSSIGVLLTEQHRERESSDKINKYPESEREFWLPFTESAKKITYDTRFIISDNEITPLVYKVSGLRDRDPEGIFRVFLKRDKYVPEVDNFELRIADYYKSSNIPVTPPEDKSGTSVITCSGSSPLLKIGGSFRTLFATFYDNNGEVLSSIYPSWDFSLPEGKEDKFEIIIEEDEVKIRALKDYGLIDSFVEVHVDDENGGFYSSLRLEVVV